MKALTGEMITSESNNAWTIVPTPLGIEAAQSKAGFNNFKKKVLDILEETLILLIFPWAQIWNILIQADIASTLSYGALF